MLFLEVERGDASEFSEVLLVQGVARGRLSASCACKSPAIPNAIAALLLHIRDRTGKIPHVYFGWTEGNPVTYLLKFLAFGEGDTAPVTREVLRQAEADPLRRPRVHVDRAPTATRTAEIAKKVCSASSASSALIVVSGTRPMGLLLGPEDNVDESEHPVVQEMYAVHANHQVATGREEAIRNQLAV